jgi:hypothetical protein
MEETPQYMIAWDFETDAKLSLKTGDENYTRRERAVGSEVTFNYKEMR